MIKIRQSSSTDTDRQIGFTMASKCDPVVSSKRATTPLSIHIAIFSHSRSLYCRAKSIVDPVVEEINNVPYIRAKHIIRLVLHELRPSSLQVG